MVQEKIIYRCDRCGKEIDSSFFERSKSYFKCTMTFEEYEQVKYGYLPDNKVPLPDADLIVIDGICGYGSRPPYRKIHLCRKCTRDYKKFMKRKI